MPNQAVLIAQAPVEPTQDQVNGKATIEQLRVMIQSPSLGSMYNQLSPQTFKVAAKDTFIDSLAFCWKIKMVADGSIYAAAPVIVRNIYTVYIVSSTVEYALEPIH